MMKGRVVLQQKNVLDLNNVGASIVDGVYELFRRTISLQLISAIHPDHESSGLTYLHRQILLQIYIPLLICSIT